MTTKIEWTEDTWNPTIGCSKVSAGCKNCYAINTAWIRMGNPNPKMQAKFHDTVYRTEGGALNWTGNINLGHDALTIPIRKKKATLYFVNSMSDVFHPNVPEDWQDEIFAVMAICGQHTFQLLTKHPDNMLAYLRGNWRERVMEKLAVVYREQSKALFDICEAAQFILQHNTHLPNIWLGVSVEHQAAADERIPLLLQCPAEVRFLSCEPLLGAVDIWKWLKPKKFCNKCGFMGRNYYKQGALDGLHTNCNYQAYDVSDRQTDIHWVIVGGESGPDARPMFPAWAQSLRDQCAAAGVAFFFKQWGEWVPIEHWGDSKVLNKLYMWADGHTATDVFHRAGEGTGQIMAKVGKKRAGNLLDFTEYKEMPGNTKVKS